MTHHFKALSIALAPILLAGMAASASGPAGEKPRASQPVRKMAIVPKAAAAILWDQTDLPSGQGSAVQNFETANDAFDCQGADDFVVPALGWTISRVNAPGTYTVSGGPAPSVDVIINANSAGVPGAPVAGCTYLAVVPTTDTAGTFAIDLVPPCVLSAGTYWLQVQTNMSFTPTGQHFWSTRTTANGTGAVWQNPGGGFGTACTTWGPLATCLTASPDFLFSLEGAVLPVELQSLQAE